MFSLHERATVPSFIIAANSRVAASIATFAIASAFDPAACPNRAKCASCSKYNRTIESPNCRAISCWAPPCLSIIGANTRSATLAAGVALLATERSAIFTSMC